MEIHFSCKTNHRLTNSNDMYPPLVSKIRLHICYINTKAVTWVRDSFEAKPVT